MPDYVQSVQDVTQNVIAAIIEDLGRPVDSRRYTDILPWGPATFGRREQEICQLIAKHAEPEWRLMNMRGWAGLTISAAAALHLEAPEQFPMLSTRWYSAHDVGLEPSLIDIAMSREVLDKMGRIFNGISMDVESGKTFDAMCRREKADYSLATSALADIRSPLPEPDAGEYAQAIAIAIVHKRLR